MEVGKKERKIGNEILLAGGESNIERLVGRTTTTEREREETERMEEITMISLNIRGFNTEAKQEVIGNFI
jgi:hypothetical protein